MLKTSVVKVELPGLQAHSTGLALIGISEKGPEEKQGGLTCLEWDFGSGGLKKESGSFLILMGTEGGTREPFGFITALKSASRSVSESPRTWTIWCPAGGLCWLGSIVPQKRTANFYVSQNVAFRKTHKNIKLGRSPNFSLSLCLRAAGTLEITTVSGSCSESFYSRTADFFTFLHSVLAVEICSETQRFLVVSCWHTCECNKAHIYSTLEFMLSSGPNFPSPLFHQKKKKKKSAQAAAKKAKKNNTQTHNKRTTGRV